MSNNAPPLWFTIRPVSFMVGEESEDNRRAIKALLRLLCNALAKKGKLKNKGANYLVAFNALLSSDSSSLIGQLERSAECQWQYWDEDKMENGRNQLLFAFPYQLRRRSGSIYTALKRHNILIFSHFPINWFRIFPPSGFSLSLERSFIESVSSNVRLSSSRRQAL